MEKKKKKKINLKIFENNLEDACIYIRDNLVNFSDFCKDWIGFINIFKNSLIIHEQITQS